MTAVLADIGGVRFEVDAPAELHGPLSGVFTGASVAATPPADVGYRITAEGEGRYGLERDGGGLVRGVGGQSVVDRLLADAVQVVGRRSPGSLLIRAGVVGLSDRAVVVLGAEGEGTSTLVSALVRAGATRYADGLAVFDAEGGVHPVAVGGPDPAPRLPVALVVSTGFEAEAEWRPDEVRGARAPLALLSHLLDRSAAAPGARALARHLAGHVVELRGVRPDAAAVVGDILARAAAVVLPDPPFGPEVEPVAASRSWADPVPARFVRFDDFLDEDDHARLLAFALAHETAFAPSSVTPTESSAGAYADLRRSLTLHDIDEVWDLFDRRLVGLLPHVRTELGVPWFELGRLERQLTVHGDGDHFTLHVDNSGPDVAEREISAVYYFNREPRRFTGGELWLFDTVEHDGVIEAVDSHTEIAPRDNTLVFFPSHTYHEVRPVEADAATAFGDRRFTIVFWARRATAVAAVFQGDPDTITARQHQIVPSLTRHGFQVVPTPPSVQGRLRRLFDEGVASAPPERSDAAYLPSGDPRLIPVGEDGAGLLTEMQGLHEAWCGQPLVPSAAYGIRVYGEGQTLRPHCDRVETHVISSVVHIAADVDEPWALTIDDADGRRHEVLLQPGETLLYESAKLPHGRPEPLHGRHYASMFFHYAPVDWATTLHDACQQAIAEGRLRPVPR